MTDHCTVCQSFSSEMRKSGDTGLKLFLLEQSVRGTFRPRRIGIRLQDETLYLQVQLIRAFVSCNATLKANSNKAADTVLIGCP